MCHINKNRDIPRVWFGQNRSAHISAHIHCVVLDYPTPGQLQINQPCITVSLSLFPMGSVDKVGHARMRNMNRIASWLPYTKNKNEKQTFKQGTLDKGQHSSQKRILTHLSLRSCLYPSYSVYQQYDILKSITPPSVTCSRELHLLYISFNLHIL